MDVRPCAAAVLFVLTALPAFAAPFVAGDPQSLSTRIAASRAAVIVRPATVDGAESVWIIVAVLHDASETVAVGQTVRPRPAPPPGTRLALLISNPDRTVEAIPLSNAAAAYVSSLPAADAPPAERLRFALGRLDHADPLVANDAFAELARFTAAEFDRHRDLLPRDRLRTLIDADDVTGDRLGLYGYLLGLCGTPEDAPRLRRRLFAADGFTTGADGLAAGYLLLTGEEGLADLEAHVLLTDHTSPLLAAAVLEALAFFRSERTGPFTADRLRQAACCALARHDAADLAVGHLAAGKDWAALPEVAALLVAAEPDPDRGRAGQVSAVRFLLECRRDGDAPPDLRAAAGRLLDQVAADDADLLRRATHLSGGPPERH